MAVLSDFYCQPSHAVPSVSVTILTASFIALSQDGLKRRLAFSTIGQLSCIILGVALLTPSGITGGRLHIAMHAFGKITLFFCVGAIFVATGRKNISAMAGIGKRMPITMGAFFIGSLSVIGLPPCVCHCRGCGGHLPGVHFHHLIIKIKGPKMKKELTIFDKPENIKKLLFVF